MPGIVFAVHGLIDGGNPLGNSRPDETRETIRCMATVNSPTFSFPSPSISDNRLRGREERKKSQGNVGLGWDVDALRTICGLGLLERVSIG